MTPGAVLLGRHWRRERHRSRCGRIYNLVVKWREGVPRITMAQHNLPEVTGTPDWPRAREVAVALMDLPSSADEEEVRSRIRELLGRLFPKLAYPEIAVQYQTGDGPADIVCRNLVVETKGEGKLDAPRLLPDGSAETPEEQLERYIAALSSAPGMFFEPVQGWQGLVTDGKRWDFHEFDPDKPSGTRLVNAHTLRLNCSSDVTDLLLRLTRTVDSESNIAPPTHDGTWADDMVSGFVKLASRVSTARSFQLKLALWRDMLKGAFITSPESDEAEINLFASHTMLVIVARAVANAIEPTGHVFQDVRNWDDDLSRGFAAWLLDVGGHEGAELIDKLVREVNRYEWRRSDKDHLKDLYHAVIPRDIRHDFGEYYTPDWLARAVCEEVLDAEWREQVIDAAVAGTIAGPAVLDPSCGSGTFLYHASKLLLETAAEHPKLAGSPHEQADMVNMLVAGIDLHPVAVELAKTTKALAFASELNFRITDSPGIFLGDSLQWSLRTEQVQAINGKVIELPTGDAHDPIRLPYSLVMSDRFMQHLNRIFQFAQHEGDPQSEDALLALLDLRSEADRKTVVAAFRRFQDYMRTGRNHVWKWYIENLVQPLRLGAGPMTRLVGNPPWVVYGKMTSERQDKLRAHAIDRNVWAPAKNAPNNDLAATFVATCVDEYLAPGGRFGFVMPYAMLRGRQWEPFRTGEWSSLTTDTATKADLSSPAWDMTQINEPPFPHVHSSVVFGTKVDSKTGAKSAQPLKSILRASGDGVNTSMGWDEVKTNLNWTRTTEWQFKPSDEYANRFRRGADLSPQSLVVFEESASRPAIRGRVRFTTSEGKGNWRGLSRQGVVEERFVLKAIFSTNIVPFGANGHSNVIAPVTENGRQLTKEVPTGDAAADFRDFWITADLVYRQTRTAKSAPDLLSQIDNRGKLSARLAVINQPFVCYNRSGSWLYGAVVKAGSVVDSTLYWMSSDDEDELHYLAAIFNAPALKTFFNECRMSDRDFHTGPIRSLPIPAYDAEDANHQQLVKASRAAHRRVAKLDGAKRDAVLADRYVRRNLAQIDESVRKMLLEYCAER